MPEPVDPSEAVEQPESVDAPELADAAAVDGPKLLRVQATLYSIVSELRLMTEDGGRPADGGPAPGHPVDSERARRRLAAIEERLLVELGSALPDPLLDELGRDVGTRPVRDASEGELRVVAAQLLGWAEGLLAALAVAPPDAVRPEQG